MRSALLLTSLLGVAISLSACVVVPARPVAYGYYGPPAPVYAYRPVYRPFYRY